MINKHKDCYNEKNGFASMPIEHIGKFYNACTDPCDMLSGPCACGAGHGQQEWPDWLQLEVFGFVSDKDSRIKRKEIKIESACGHNNLTSYGNYTGIVVTVDDQIDTGSKVEGMFTYKKYECIDCGKIITILNAVVEKTK
jgi:hypothetical protein